MLGKSNKKAWRKCQKCGYEWEAQINARSSGRGCPNCAQDKRNESKKRTLLKKRNLRNSRPDVAIDWHPTKNVLSPDEVTCGVNTRVWWKCHICGNEWEDSVAHVVGGRGCKKCRRRKKEMDNP